MNTMVVDRNQQVSTLLCRALMIAAPFVLLGVISLAVGANAFGAYPVWSNELGYWRSLFSWQNAGLHTGYSGLLEFVPAVGTLGLDGVAPILIYGWFVRLFGLNHNTLLLCNAVWLSLAAAVFCVLRKPKAGTALWMTALEVLYVPIILYCTTSMTELFDYALLLLYLSFFLCYAQEKRVWALPVCVLLVILGCLYRPLYGLLFLPLALVFGRYRLSGRTVLATAVFAALFAITCWFGIRHSAPDAQRFMYHLLNAPDVSTFVRMLLSHSKANLNDFFLRTVSPIEAAQRWLYCCITLLCLVGAFVRPRRTNGKLRLQTGFDGACLCCFLLLFAAFGLVIMLYAASDWRDYRRLAPMLWLVLMFLAARSRLTLPALGLTASVATLALLIAIGPIGAFADAYRFTPAPVSPALSEAIAAITYDDTAADPFHNTVRTDVESLQTLRELNPALGVQTGWFTTETTGKSRWILTDHLKCPVSGYERVTETEGYKVYRLTQPTKEDEYDP